MHKVNEPISFNDFKARIHGSPAASRQAEPSAEDLRATIESSRAVIRMM